MVSRKLLLTVIAILVLFQACPDAIYNPFQKDTYKSPESQKDITSFIFEASKNTVLSIDAIGIIGKNIVDVTVPYNTNITALIPTINITGKSINPGTNVAQTFSDGVGLKYTVTGNDGSKKEYMVTVHIAKNDAKDINLFVFASALNPALSVDLSGVITGTNIDCIVPSGTDISNLIPTIGITGISINPASGAAHAFTDGAGVPYTVTAADASTKIYTITVFKPPKPENSGVITFSGIGTNSITLDWTKATDDQTPQANLLYLVYYSMTNNIDTVVNIETNGIPVGVYTTDITSKTINGLLDSKAYYFNVIVQDQNGDKAAYAMGSQATADGTPPIAGNSGVLTFSGVTTNTVTVNWTKATDNITPQANLQYLVYYSTSNNIDTVANIEANGTAVGSYSTNINAMPISSLTDSIMYYFNVIVKDSSNNKRAYIMNSQGTGDGTPPVAGNSGTLTFSGISSSAITINWTKATDNQTAQANLQYLLYYSLTNNIDTVGNIEGNGTPIGTYSSDMNTKTASGLSDGITYYFNVIVKDQNNNKTAYAMGSQATLDITPPVAGNSGALSFVGVTANSITVNWTKATDNSTPQASLQYLLYYSMSNNIDTVTNIEANGTAAGTYAADINSKTVNTLTEGATYYFNVIVKDLSNNKRAYVMSLQATPDGTPPQAGNSGTLTFSGVSANSITVNWTKATDNSTPQASLLYLLYYSTSNNIDTVTNIEANGTAAGTYAANINSKTVNALTEGATYYFNVIVKDLSNNKSAYLMGSQATTDVTPPVAGNSGTLSYVGITSSSITVNWTKATDNSTPQANLMYLLYYSTSNNIDTVTNIEANGTAAGTYTADINSKTLSSLLDSKTYYFNVIVKDLSNNKKAYTMSSATTTDGTPPVPGNSGMLTFSGATAHTINVGWTKATDNISAQSTLQYLVYYSTSNNINSVVNAEANGTSFGTYSADINTKLITGLSDSTPYYFNVIVKDENSNKAAYSMSSYTMPDAIPPAQVIITNVTEGNAQVILQWTDPADADFDHVEITWSPGGSTINPVSKGVQTFTATGLTNTTEYTFSIVSVDTATNKSSAVVIKATPTTSGPFISYCIYTDSDLNAIRGGIKAGWDKTKSYIIMADINLSAYSPWTPIGSSSSDYFSGNLNGNGHTITGLTINRSASDYNGLFGYVNGSSAISNLSIINCNITGGNYTGGLVGYFNSTSILAAIRNCYVSGTITGNGMNAGGMAGQVYGSGAQGKMSGCGTNVTVTGTSFYIGGLVGQANLSWQITECYSSGSVTGTGSGGFIGGLVGYLNVTVTNCYTRCVVTSDGTYVAGFTGGTMAALSTNYATGNVTRSSGTGSFAGFSSYGSGAITGSYYNCVLSSGLTDNAAGTRKTTAEMQTQTTYSGWDFTTKWNIDPLVNDGYPYLRNNPPR
jgi:hypothetical protein